MTRSAVICGAGPAGLSLARYLGLAGWQVVLVERSSAVRPGGYAVDLRGDGLLAAQELGVLEQLRAHVTGMRGTTLLDADGHPVGELPAEAFGGELEVPKPRLTQVLLDALPADVDLRFDESVAAVVQDDDGLEVRLDGGARLRADLLVGADGLWSRIRRLVFAESTIRHLGMSGIGFTTDNVLGLDHRGVLRTVGGTAVYAFSSTDPDRLTVSLSFGTDSPALDRAGDGPQRAAVREAFTGQGWLVPQLLEAMDDADDRYFASACQVHLPRWSSGRVVLLGDAGYCAAPTSGMGTTQALVGARTLAQTLRGHPVPTSPAVRSALAEYEARLRPVVEVNQRLGAQAAADFGAAGTA